MSTETVLKSILVLIIMAAFFGYITDLIYSSEQDFVQWNRAPGRILSIDIKSQAKSSVSGTANGSMQNYWMVLVNYEYSVNSKSYTGSRLSNSPSMESDIFNSQPSSALTDYLTRYPVDKEVSIYYSPDHPEKSFLEIITGGYKGFLYVTMGVLSIALILFILWILSIFQYIPSTK